MKELNDLIEYLKNAESTDKKILFLTTSNRWEGDNEIPKSTILAKEISSKLKKISIIDVTKLKIYDCEGNVSTKRGSTCGIKEAILKNKEKNPTGNIRCWASVNHKDDELYKAANSILESDIIIFFGSIRWGKMNATYSRLIERLTWLEARKSTLNESSLLKDKECGFVFTGHNWRVNEAIKLEKQVMNFFDFKTPDVLSFGHQWTNDMNDETNMGYKKDYKDFIKKFDPNIVNESNIDPFTVWVKYQLRNS